MESAIGLVRVSTSSQAEDGCSLVLQKEKITAYAKLNDLHLTDIVEEAGVSGRAKRREGLDKVMALIESGTIKHLIIYKLDRLSRSIRQALEISDSLQRYNAVLHSVTEKLDTGSPQGKLFFNLMNALASFECDLISQRTKDALRGKRDRGEVYTHPSYGLNATEDGKLIEDPLEQKVIKRIRRYRKEGASYSSIANRLNAEGLPTKWGKQWTHKQVSRILSV